MVDVIIPVYHPDGKLAKLIDRLNSQTMAPGHVIFMQTMTDTDEDERVGAMLKKAAGARIVPVKRDEFDHGGTRNQGASLSKAEYVLFMTQDAVPEDDDLIGALYRSITSDERIAAAYGRQLAGDEVGAVERLTRDFNYPAESSVKDAGDLERLGIKTYFCSNVCAMYRKSVYEELGGFVLHTIFNEDMIFASKVIGAGYRIAYAAEAKVVHAHRYTYWQQLTRNFDMAVSQRQYREVFEGIQSESEGIRLVKDTAGRLIKSGKWYLIPDLILQSGFKFLGYRLGLHYEKLPDRVVRWLSMNKNYW